MLLRTNRACAFKGHVQDAIKEAIGGEITTMNAEIKHFQAKQAAARSPATRSASEVRASDADAHQRESLPGTTTTPEEEVQLEANLRGLAVTLKRDGETDEQAFERVRSSKYIIAFHHDDYWPFYDVKHRFDRVILTINSAHPFFTELYEPVRKMCLEQATMNEDETAAPSEEQSRPLVALDLLLLSLARTQSRMAGRSEETNKVIDALRREWSDAYRVQMIA